MTTKTYGATGTGSSGKVQYFTAGTAGTYQITAAGAQGGNGYGPTGGAGGLGATASGDIYLAKGAKLEIVVGQQGGGGSGLGGGHLAGGGGGGSFVIEYDNATAAYDIDEVIAGGGGGGGTNSGGGDPGGAGTVNGSGAAGMGGKGFGGGGGGFTGGAGAGPGGTGSPGSNNATTFDGGSGASSGGSGGFGGGGGSGYTAGGGGGGFGGGNGGSGSSGGEGGGSYVNTTGTNPVTNAAQTPGDNMRAGFVRIAMVCFAGGTRIRTARGDVPVERLAVGDLAITASGALRPIRWIGQRTIDCLSHPSPHDAHPVRISAHAFAPNQPARELFLSPGHPVLVGADADNDGGHLVPVMCLINGTTVRRDAVDTVTYWHVELDAHDILLAENLPAESYIDLGSRPWFAGADGALYDPDMALPGMPGRCRPVAIDGPVVEAERRRLDGVFAMRLAAACAWPDAAAHAAM